MASTWSALKVELQGTGDNPGTWGTATNVNLGDAVLGEAITGSATVDFASDADVTITLTDSVASQSARNLRLNITESSTGIGSVRNLILGSGCQIEKFYLINNTGTGAKTVKNTSGTGITVPAGKATLVYNNGTNVVDAASYFTSLTLGSALPVASGGTGITSLGSGVATFLGTPSSANLAAAVTDETGSGALVFATSPALVTPNLGTPTTLVLTSATGLPLSSGVTGTLPVANGGTGQTTYTNGQLLIGNTTGNTLTKATLTQGTGVTITNGNGAITIAATGSGGTVTSVGGTGTVNGISLSGTVTSTGNLTLGGTLSGVSLTSQVTGTLPIANGGTGTTSTTFANLTTNVTGTLPVANGGTGAATLTANNVLLGNGTSALQVVAPGSSGNVLTSNGSTWASTAPAGGSSIVRSTRTSNTILGTADASTLIAITSGTFTQTFTAAATLGSGWFCYIQNLGTGDITLDPNASETIDGLTSYIMYPGEARLVQCNGTAFFTLVINSFIREYSTTSTFTAPPGYDAFGIDLVGGGGGGGGTIGSDPAGSGGGGARVQRTVPASLVTGSITATIGAGGAGGTTSNGIAGGNTTFGSLFTAYGGGLGARGGAAGSGGGSASAGGANTTGGTPRPSVIGLANSTASGNTGGGGGGSGGVSQINGGNAEWGGGGGGYGVQGTGGDGGSSVWGPGGGGGGGRASGSGGRGGACSSYTAGGGGTVVPGGGAGGNGADGTLFTSGAGGGGGTSTNGATGYSGGNGGYPGGGGGGTGADSGSTTGLGGTGGNGRCVIWGIA